MYLHYYTHIITLLPVLHNRTLAMSILKCLQATISVVQVFVDKIENIVGKGENAGDQHFLLFP